MKSRRVILTIEVQTCLPLSELRDPYSITFPHRGGGGTVFADPGMEKQGVGYGTIVQVQANAIRPEPKGKRKALLDRKAAFAERSAYRARLAKFAKEDARLAAADRLKQLGGINWKRVHAVDEILDHYRDAVRQRKAKRAKGAK